VVTGDPSIRPVTDARMPPNSVYVGREVKDRRRGTVRFGKSKGHNPFTIGRDGTRDEVIALYRLRVLSQPELMAALPELHGKDLICWCAPDPCHADVLARPRQCLVGPSRERHGRGGWSLTVV
jgi:Domain of unknown function (DUF4326)